MASRWLGSRARIGLLVPHNSVVSESELQATAPDGVSAHAARVSPRCAARTARRAGTAPLGLDPARAQVAGRRQRLRVEVHGRAVAVCRGH